MRDDIRSIIGESIAVKQRLIEDQHLVERIAAAAQVCIEALKGGNRILLAGNGGSAADAQHIAAEFVSRFERDRTGLPALALTTDTSMLTAISNDYGYEHVFSRQLQANGRAGDVFIGLSTSGNSKNVLAALEASRRLAIKPLGLSGAGGRMNELCDICIAVPSTSTARIQESHILIGHVICKLVEDALFPMKSS